MRNLLSFGVIATSLIISSCGRDNSENIEHVLDAPEPVVGNIENAFSSDETWQRARMDVASRIAIPHRPQSARNVILFIADGMSIPTITASRIYEGQAQGGSGVENVLSFEAFPHLALVRTYNTDAQVSDSASTATALVTGIKTRTGAINVAPEQALEVCEENASVPSHLAEIAEQRGMDTGVISTARMTHATPATMFSHSLSRNWETDADLPDWAQSAGCEDIASQLISFDAGDGMDVILGGGRRSFLPADAGGRRSDQRDLMAEWRDLGRDGITVSDAEGLRALDPSDPAPVFGLFTDSHMAYEADRDDGEEPSLAEMTSFAISRLSQSEEGYVLMVEAGRVDHAHHGTNAYRALTDTQAFSDAISAAVDQVDLEETLIVVTADHGHTMTMSGYPARDNPILGLVRRVDPVQPGSDPQLTLANDGNPYTTLGYQNGRHLRLGDGEALTDEGVVDPDYMQESAVPVMSETHSGADVALFATGPRSYLFGGSLEQNSVFHLISYALEWDEESQDSGEETE